MRGRDSQISFEVFALLYSRPFPFEELGRVANSAIAAGAGELRGALVISEVGLTRLLPETLATNAVEFARVHGSEDSLAGHLRGRFGKEEIAGVFVALRHPQHPLVWLVLTDAPLRFLRKPLPRLLRQVYPRPLAPILTTSQVRHLFERLQADRRVDQLRVAQVGARGHIQSEGARKRIEGDRRWTDLSLDEAFEGLLSEGQWVTDATAEYEYFEGRRGRLTISRRGMFRFMQEALIPINALLDDAVGFANQWYAFLKDRQRRRETDFRSRPFQITFNYPALATEEQVAMLAAALRSVPNTNLTVLHSNPFFHAVLVDWHDGSTNEVLVLDDTTMSVLPQGRSTVRSLRSLCSRVFSEFREGDLEDVHDV